MVVARQGRIVITRLRLVSVPSSTSAVCDGGHGRVLPLRDASFVEVGPVAMKVYYRPEAEIQEYRILIDGELVMDELRFPDNFPPTSRWDKFFLGVRWLGPDLSFFHELKQHQASRNANQMALWGGGIRQELAEAIGKILSHSLGWKSEVFLPADTTAVIFHGPSFDFTDPETAFEKVVEMLKTDFGIAVEYSFWIDKEDTTFGVLVDALLLAKT